MPVILSLFCEESNYLEANSHCLPDEQSAPAGGSSPLLFQCAAWSLSVILNLKITGIIASTDAAVVIQNGVIGEMFS